MRTLDICTKMQVDMKDFAPYLQSIGHKIEDFERNKAAAQSVADKMLLPGTVVISDHF